MKAQKQDANRELEWYDEFEPDWIYLYERPQKALICDSVFPNGLKFSSWMSHVPSHLSLSSLSIPGSHESCATIPVPWVQCQTVSIEKQLSIGIRYFDFRLGVTFNSLRLYHGRSPLGFTLVEILVQMYEFLDKNPSEALMLQIKMEGGNSDEHTFEELFRTELASRARYWALGNTIPILGAVRGRIQLMRRFRIGSGDLGIDVRRWADNSARFWIPIARYSRLVVQDEYEFTNRVGNFPELIQKKVNAIENLIREADIRRSYCWCLNWCNAFAGPFSFGVVATPSDIALGRDKTHGVNALLHETLCKMSAKARVGTVLLDFIDPKKPDLIFKIIMSNELVDL